MAFSASGIIAFASGLSLVSPLAAASDVPRHSQIGSSGERQAVQKTFGINLNESLLNPGEPATDEAALTRQLALVFRDARSLGASTIRWIVTDVWPQWHCSTDPEDWRSGIDQQWFVVAEALLQAAEENNMRVVFVLSNLTNNGFGGVAPKEPEGEQNFHRWTEHRLSTVGRDSYRNQSACSVYSDSYFGHSEQDLFTTPELIERLRHRFSMMTRFLSAFPALGGLELFNEPDFQLTHRPEYWRAVAELLKSTRASLDPHSTVPVYSGTAAWDDSVVRVATDTGALELEPFLTIHLYNDYTQPPEILIRDLEGDLAYLSTIAPGKPVVISEAGSSVALRSMQDHNKMVRVLFDLYGNSAAGLWVWGTWFPKVDGGDYRWLFNDRSIAGSSFRPYIINEIAEQALSSPITFQRVSGSKTVPVEVQITAQLPDQPSGSRNYGLVIDSFVYRGFSRAGIVPLWRKGPAWQPFSDTIPSYLISDQTGVRKWAAIIAESAGLILEEFVCDDRNGQITTPDAFLALAQASDRHEFTGCLRSRAEGRTRLAP